MRNRPKTRIDQAWRGRLLGLTTLAALSLTAGCTDGIVETSVAAFQPGVASLTTASSGTTLELQSKLAVGKCVEAENGVTLLAACNDGVPQKFVWESTGLIRAGGLCLTVPAGPDGQQLTLKACGTDASQTWSATDAGEIRSASGKCVDIDGAKTVAGTPVILWACHSGANQKWSVTSAVVPPPPAVVVEPTVRLESKQAVGMCTTLVGSVATLGLCSDSVPQQQLVWDADGAIRLDGLCLTAKAAGQQLALSGCTGEAGQKWRTTAAGEIRSGANMCIDINGAKTAAGTPIITWDCHGRDNQKWQVRGTVAGTGTPAPRPVVPIAPIPTIPPVVPEPPVEPQPPVTTRRGFHVSPTGTSAGDGSPARPWNLATALAAPASVQPGDTVWLAAGTYAGQWTSRLAGTPDRPVVIRAIGRVTIIGRIVVEGANSWLWGIEVTQRAGAWLNAETVVLNAPGTRVINSVIHHAGHVGVAAFEKSVGAEIYGSLIYGNFGHGIYAQNPADSPKYITDNLVFNAAGAHYGLHLYAENGGLKNFIVEGNFAWHNGTDQPELLYGGCRNVSGGVVKENVFWHKGRGGSSVRIGYGEPQYGCEQASNMTVERNTMVSGWPALRVTNVRGSVVRENTVVAGDYNEIGLLVGSGSNLGATYEGNAFHGFNRATEILWPTGPSTTSKQKYMAFAEWARQPGNASSNTFHTSAPTASKVVVRPNEYEPGRANVAVLNWSRAGSVPVDLSSVLKVGQRYEIRHAQRFYGAPVAEGVYGGGTVSFPAVTVQPERTVYWCPAWRVVQCKDAGTPPATGAEFNVFVVLPVD